MPPARYCAEPIVNVIVRWSAVVNDDVALLRLIGDRRAELGEKAREAGVADRDGDVAVERDRALEDQPRSGEPEIRRAHLLRAAGCSAARLRTSAAAALETLARKRFIEFEVASGKRCDALAADADAHRRRAGQRRQGVDERFELGTFRRGCPRRGCRLLSTDRHRPSNRQRRPRARAFRAESARHRRRPAARRPLERPRKRRPTGDRAPGRATRSTGRASTRRPWWSRW
jgi:hypothetical protein